MQLIKATAIRVLAFFGAVTIIAIAIAPDKPKPEPATEQRTPAPVAAATPEPEVRKAIPVTSQPEVQRAIPVAPKPVAVPRRDDLASQVTPSGSIVISADDLAAAFDQNAIAAEQTYGQKRVTIVGRVESIGVALGDIPYVCIEAEGTLTGFQCTFSKDDKPNLARFAKGQKVAVTGIVRFGAVMGHMLKECVIEPVNSKPKPASESRMARRK